MSRERPRVAMSYICWMLNLTLQNGAIRIKRKAGINLNHIGDGSMPIEFHLLGKCATGGPDGTVLADPEKYNTDCDDRCSLFKMCRNHHEAKYKKS